jgi:hypothetical protein
MRRKCTDAVIREVQRRLEAGEKQKTIEFAVGIDQTTVSLIKRGAIKPAEEMA